MRVQYQRFKNPDSLLEFIWDNFSHLEDIGIRDYDAGRRIWVADSDFDSNFEIYQRDIELEDLERKLGRIFPEFFDNKGNFKRGAVVEISGDEDDRYAYIRVIKQSQVPDSHRSDKSAQEVLDKLLSDGYDDSSYGTQQFVALFKRAPELDTPENRSRIAHHLAQYIVDPRTSLGFPQIQHDNRYLVGMVQFFTPQEWTTVLKKLLTFTQVSLRKLAEPGTNQYYFNTFATKISKLTPANTETAISRVYTPENLKILETIKAYIEQLENRRKSHWDDPKMAERLPGLGNDDKFPLDNERDIYPDDQSDELEKIRKNAGLKPQ